MGDKGLIMMGGGDNMSLCPFWSNEKEKINCYEECVFSSSEEDSCPFKLYLETNRIVLKDIADFRYDEENFKFSQNW